MADLDLARLRTEFHEAKTEAEKEREKAIDTEDLHRDALRLLADKNDALRAELARLRRILAVECGHPSAAPEGWERVSFRWQRRHPTAGGVYVERERGVWMWATDRTADEGAASTALEAMEAADAALAEVTRG